MVVPSFEMLLLPVLQTLGERGELQKPQLASLVQARFQPSAAGKRLTAAQLEAQAALANRLLLAQVHLRAAGLIAAGGAAALKITPAGQELLARRPPQISAAMLKVYPEYAAIIERLNTKEELLEKRSEKWDTFQEIVSEFGREFLKHALEGVVEAIVQH